MTPKLIVFLRWKWFTGPILFDRIKLKVLILCYEVISICAIKQCKQIQTEFPELNYWLGENNVIFADMNYDPNYGNTLQVVWNQISLKEDI